MAGYCAHVIALIYFLSFARYIDYYDAASQLRDYVVNMKKKDNPNKAFMSKQKRRKNSEKFEFKCNEKNKRQKYFDDKNSRECKNKSCEMLNQNQENIQDLTNNKTNSDKPADSGDTNKENKSDSSNNDKMLSKPVDEKKDSAEKNKSDSSKRNKNNNIKNKIDVRKNNDQFIQKFKDHIIPWGGEIIYRTRKTKVTNTCTIDYHLLALWAMFNLSPTFLDNFDHLWQTAFLKEIINNIEIYNFNKAKETWIVEILRFNQDEGSISLFDTQSEVFTDKLADYQSYVTYQMCKHDCPLNDTYMRNGENFHIFFNRDLDGNLLVYTGLTHRCRNCDAMTTPRFVFNTIPTFLFIQSMDNDIYYQEIPKEITFNNVQYSHISTTLHKPDTMFSVAHFIGVFHLFGNDYVVDDLSRSFQILQPYQKSKNYGRSSENDVYNKLRTTFSCYIKTDILG
jgi:hypothetical protein